MSEINQRLLKVAQFFALAALFFIPISVALVNTFVALFALSVFLNRNFWSSLSDLWQLPVVKATMLLFLAMWIAVAYSSAPLKEAFDFGIKYQKKLLLIPLLIWVFGQSNLQERIRWTLMVSLSFVLMLSYAYALRDVITGSGTTVRFAVAFTDRISQGVSMGLLFCMALLLAQDAQDRRVKVGLRLIAMLAAVDVMFLLTGKTGQVCLLVVAIWLLFKNLAEVYAKNRTKSLTIAGVGLLLIAAFLVVSMQQKSSRMTNVEAEIAQGTETSSGQRMEFYSMSLKMIENHPLIGTGMGSVGIEFDRAASNYGTTLKDTMRNAHNEYLMMMIQMGVPGLLLFVWLLVCVYRSARQLPAIERDILQAYVVIFSVGCLPNSFLADFNEGHTFVFLVGIFLAPLYCKQPSSPVATTA